MFFYIREERNRRKAVGHTKIRFFFAVIRNAAYSLTPDSTHEAVPVP